ncbi:amine-terminal region of a tm vesicle-mediated sorter [Cyclospora cayetanensis]|uniref:Amine-terminal region of a tm vesicle-mediated sorter n=1 Tax=Cyclospora cayetanensis TaxID=88456 RepID=A0A1D3D580_9EIME|nr:amine-terminal region of a tm vesicle-mediated sorter [Cyclospora cayetanensis]
MEYLKQFFKRAIAKYVEVGGDDMISIGYDQGIEFRDLRLNTKAINDMLQASDAEARLEFGRIGRMNLVYTPLPGIVTIQVKDLDIRVKPNFTGLALRKLVETLYEIGDLDSSDLSPSYLQGGHCMPYGGSFPSSACGYQPGPEIHNTQARFVHPCRLPRAPPIVRRARFVKALPTAPIHFQQPVRGFSCEGAQSCMHSFAQSQDMSLERLCNDFSLLSNSLVSTCGATNARMIEKCEEVKNLFSNCVEAVAGIAPPDYDRLEKIKLPMDRPQPDSEASFSRHSRQQMQQSYCQPSEVTPRVDAALPSTTMQAQTAAAMSLAQSVKPLGERVDPHLHQQNQGPVQGRVRMTPMSHYTAPISAPQHPNPGGLYPYAPTASPSSLGRSRFQANSWAPQTPVNYPYYASPPAQQTPHPNGAQTLNQTTVYNTRGSYFVPSPAVPAPLQQTQATPLPRNSSEPTPPR